MIRSHKIIIFILVSCNYTGCMERFSELKIAYDRAHRASITFCSASTPKHAALMESHLQGLKNDLRDVEKMLEKPVHNLIIKKILRIEQAINEYKVSVEKKRTLFIITLLIDITRGPQKRGT